MFVSNVVKNDLCYEFVLIKEFLLNGRIMKFFSFFEEDIFCFLLCLIINMNIVKLIYCVVIEVLLVLFGSGYYCV